MVHAKWKFIQCNFYNVLKIKVCMFKKISLVRFVEQFQYADPSWILDGICDVDQ